jgi:DNA polymerase III epsilon subunit-like protein
MNNNKICVFDFETDGSDPDSCSPVQIAAVMIDPVTLQVIDGSEFNVNFKPEVIEANENYEYTTDILDFHAKVRGCSKQDILDQWKKYPKQEYSWKLFTNYLDNYHSRSSRKSQFSAPIAAGYNIHRFDLRIVERLSQKYKNLNKENRSDIFYPRDTVDIMSLMFYWFEASNELKSYSLDTVREYFGIDKHGAHDALKDVKDCAELLTRFLKLHRNLSSKIKFRNSFVENS